MTLRLRKLKDLEQEVTSLKEALGRRSPEAMRRLLETRRAQMIATIDATSLEVRIARQEAGHILLEAVRQPRFTPGSIGAACLVLLACVLAAMVIRRVEIGLVMMLLGAGLCGFPTLVKHVAQARLNREARRRDPREPDLGTVVF